VSGRVVAVQWVCLWIALLWVPAAVAQTCQTATDMDVATRTALEATAKRYFDMVARGDTASLKQNATTNVASSFDGIEAAIKENHDALAGAQATVRPPYLLTAEGAEPLARAEFLCGVFGTMGQTAKSAAFEFRNLPPGKYAIAIVDARGTQEGRALTLILQPMAADWKLAGFYIRASLVNGHDGAWYAQKAREFKSKGQNRNAWLYFLEARVLSSPADFMSTLSTDRLYDEAQTVKPSDLPQDGNAAD